MRCTEAKKLIWRAVDLALSGAESEMLDDHLAQCAECRTEHESAVKTMQLIDCWEAPEPVGDYNAFLMSLSQDSAKPVGLVFRRWLAGGLAVASIVCGVALGLVTGASVTRPVLTEEELASAIGLHTFGDMVESAIHYTSDSALTPESHKGSDL